MIDNCRRGHDLSEVGQYHMTRYRPDGSVYIYKACKLCNKLRHVAIRTEVAVSPIINNIASRIAFRDKRSLQQQPRLDWWALFVCAVFFIGLLTIGGVIVGVVLAVMTVR